MLNRGKPCDPSHACMTGCVIQSSNVYSTRDGETVVSPLEYETLGLMGSNLGLGDPDAVAKLNYICNDLGLDTIEIGAALGIAAEAGKMAFGDAQNAMVLMHEIAGGSPLGLALGHGAASAGDHLGVERIPVAKGQAISAYDPRAIKGTGVTYATSPQGADHTAGLTIRAKVDHLKPQGQAALSRSSQYKMAGYDSLGACIFASFGFSLDPLLVPDLMGTIHGHAVGIDFLETLGRETIMLEREFNRRAGFAATHDRLPAWMTAEPLPPHKTIFDVPDSDLDTLFDIDEDAYWAHDPRPSSHP
jgi:aldehyde:ferredoxin oxidoreductase